MTFFLPKALLKVPNVYAFAGQRHVGKQAKWCLLSFKTRLFVEIIEITHKITACLQYVCLLFFSILKVLKCRFWGHFLIKYSTNWHAGVNLLSSSKHSKHGTLTQVGNPKPRRLTQLMHMPGCDWNSLCISAYNGTITLHQREFIFLCIAWRFKIYFYKSMYTLIFGYI